MSSITQLVRTRLGFDFVLQTNLKHCASWPQKYNTAATNTIKKTQLVFGEITSVADLGIERDRETGGR